VPTPAARAVRAPWSPLLGFRMPEMSAWCRRVCDEAAAQGEAGIPRTGRDELVQDDGDRAGFSQSERCAEAGGIGSGGQAARAAPRRSVADRSSALPPVLRTTACVSGAPSVERPVLRDSMVKSAAGALPGPIDRYSRIPTLLTWASPPPDQGAERAPAQTTPYCSPGGASAGTLMVTTAVTRPPAGMSACRDPRWSTSIPRSRFARQLCGTCRFPRLPVRQNDHDL
jgi:hypothetical protein